MPPRNAAVLDSTWHLSPYAALAFSMFTAHAQSDSPRPVELRTSDGGTIQADMYGPGSRGVVLAHGGRFNKGSWEKQARELAKAGYRVLAIDFRGYGQVKGPGQGDILTAPLHLHVLAAVEYLRSTGATTFSAIGLRRCRGGRRSDCRASRDRSLNSARLHTRRAARQAHGPKAVHRDARRYQRRRASPAGLQAHFAAAPNPRRSSCSRVRARAVHVPDRPGRPGDARILRFISAQ